MQNENITILIAEDEENARLLYFEELTEEGYRVLTAGNGLQALGLLEDEKVDLLLTDIKMPDMHALEMIPKVREDHPTLPILVASAFKGMEDDFTLNSFHITGFFSKPIDMVRLKKMIREIFAAPLPTGV